MLSKKKARRSGIRLDAVTNLHISYRKALTKLEQESQQVIVQDIAAEMASAPDRGLVTDYIPNLASISHKQFGIAIIDNDAECYVAGDADMQFSIQSITKVLPLLWR